MLLSTRLFLTSHYPRTQSHANRLQELGRTAQTRLVPFVCDYFYWQVLLFFFCWSCPSNFHHCMHLYAPQALWRCTTNWSTSPCCWTCTTPSAARPTCARWPATPAASSTRCAQPSGARPTASTRTWASRPVPIPPASTPTIRSLISQNKLLSLSTVLVHTFPLFWVCDFLFIAYQRI